MISNLAALLVASVNKITSSRGADVNTCTPDLSKKVSLCVLAFPFSLFHLFRALFCILPLVFASVFFKNFSAFPILIEMQALLLKKV